jgi:hypothetical protein
MERHVAHTDDPSDLLTTILTSSLWPRKSPHALDTVKLLPIDTPLNGGLRSRALLHLLCETAKVPSTMTVTTMTLDDVRTHTGLDWMPATERSELPQLPGVYVWIVDDGQHVVYAGSAVGGKGLSLRAGNQLKWQAEAAMVADQRERRRIYTAVPAAAADLEASLWYAAVGGEVDAAQWERRLFALAVHLTGARPLLNGAGWDVRGPHIEADQWASAMGQSATLSEEPLGFLADA